MRGRGRRGADAAGHTAAAEGAGGAQPGESQDGRVLATCRATASL